MAQSSAPKTNGQIGDLEPYQAEFAGDTDHKYLGFVSGVGAGKTYAGIARTVANMLRWNRGQMGAIVAPARRMIIDVIIPEMRSMGLFDPPFNFEYNSAHAEQPGIHAPNGSRALLLSADNSKTIERLAGLNLAWSWLDEAARIDPRARQILMQRLRVGEYRNLYITTTPKGRNHTYDFFAKDIPEDESYIGKGKRYSDGTTMSVIGVPTEANTQLPDDYAEAMESDMPDEIRAQEVRGEFVEIGSGILTRDMLTPTDSDALDNTELSFHVGVDLGVEPDAAKAEANDTDYFAAAIIAHHRRLGEAYVVDVERKRGLSLNQGVDWLKQVIQGVPSPTINVESVHAQQYFLTACKDAGLPVQGVDQSLKKEDRLIQLSVPFENNSIQLVNFDRPPEAGLDKRWDQLAQEWIAFPDGTHDDLLDAVELALRNVSIGQTFGGDGLDIYGRGT